MLSICIWLGKTFLKILWWRFLVPCSKHIYDTKYFDYVNVSTEYTIRDCRQITFVTNNGFCPLSKPSSPHLFLTITENIKMDGIPTKNKWKMHTLFGLYFKFRRYFLFVKPPERYNQQIFYFLLFYISFYISRYHFPQIFWTSFNIIHSTFNIHCIVHCLQLRKLLLLLARKIL